MGNKNEVEMIRSDLIGAIDRIRLGVPQNERLIRLNSLGKLKLNLSNVAIEAGRSRTLIATKNSNYIDIRQMILQPRSEISFKSVSIDTIKSLREKIKILQSEIDLLKEAQLASFYTRDDAIGEARRWREAYKRLKDEVLEDSKILKFKTSSDYNK